MRGYCLTLLGLLAFSLTAKAQFSPPPQNGIPGYAGNPFGAPKDQPFDPKAILPPPPPAGGGALAPRPGAPAAPATTPPPLFGGNPNDPLLPPLGEAQAKLWSGGADLGINGASGNTELFGLRAGFNARRKTQDNLFDTDFLYSYTKTAGLVTQQQALFNARDEILFSGTPWSLFASTNVEYDELRNYRFRMGLYGGIGYIVADTDRWSWRLRSGVGQMYEIGVNGTPNRWVTEAVFGTDVSVNIDERQSFVTTIDYYPRIDNWTEYRLRARFAYQILLDANSGLMLRIGIQDRYDSVPAGSKRNDLSYFTSIGFKF